MTRPKLNRYDSTSSFGTPFEKNYGNADDVELDAKPGTQPHASLQKRARKSRLSCYYIFLVTVLVILVLASGLFLLAEFLSQPGFDKTTQDTDSMQTLQNIQDMRTRMPTVLATFRNGSSALSKQDLIGYIQLATAYSAATYTATFTPQNCNNPVKADLTQVLTSPSASVYLARDDVAKILVVAFKGMTGPRDFLNGLDTGLEPLNITGLPFSAKGAEVQKGVQDPFKSLEARLLESLEAELRTAPDYAILVTGHNLGGSMAVLAATTIKHNVWTNPSSSNTSSLRAESAISASASASAPASRPLVLCVTQGQSMTFNQLGADLIDRAFPNASQTLVRAVHARDGIVNVGAPFVNGAARHHGGEVWQQSDPLEADTVLVCRGQRDETCSVSQAGGRGVQFVPPALPWSAESTHYFGIEMNSRRSVQCGGPGGQDQYALLTSRGRVKHVQAQTP